MVGLSSLTIDFKCHWRIMGNSPRAGMVLEKDPLEHCQSSLVWAGSGGPTFPSHPSSDPCARIHLLHPVSQARYLGLSGVLRLGKEWS